MKKFGALLILIFCLTIFFSVCCLSAEASGYIVRLKKGSIPGELMNFLTVVNSDHGVYTADSLDFMDEFGEYIEHTEPNGEITLIEGNEPVSFMTLPEDELYSGQEQIKLVNAPYAWEMETYGNEVNVAVIDTGCNAHADIELAGGYNFILNTDDYTDNHGHGTHVAGIIAAQHNDIFIAGVAPKVNIYALKAYDPTSSPTGDVDELIAAIYAAVDTYKCKVINMSLGVTEEFNELYNAVKHAYDSGTIIVAAAGNEGNTSNHSRLWYPAAYEETVGVGSVDNSKNRSAFSQKNASVTVVAPGEACQSLNGTNSYKKMSGTSQASPIVAGAAALLFSADSHMTPAEFINYIANCSETLEDDYCGYGLLNIEAMFKECIKNTDYYVSPLNEDGILLYNNTDADLNAKGIFASYADGKLSLCSENELALLPGGKTKLSFDATLLKTKFFMWNSMENLQPMALEKVCE